LYRAVLDLAKENKLDEPFLWLPNLEGPVYGADPTKGSAWLFEGWSNGAPSLGWDDTIAFLILPVFLVISQFISMEIMTPKDSQQQGNIVLKLLPLMIGWFSLNVPAALCLYWVTNNIVTTATSVIIRNSMKMEPVAVGGSASAVSPTPSEIFAPPPLREKPAGFSNTPSSFSRDDVTPITSSSTSVIDAEFADDSEDSGEGMDSSENKVRYCQPSFTGNAVLFQFLILFHFSFVTLRPEEKRRRSEERTNCVKILQGMISWTMTQPNNLEEREMMN
jgi:hypothetical protein